MKLTDEQKQKIHQRLRFKNSCPNCDSTTPFMFAEYVFHLVSYENSGTNLFTNEKMPYIPLFTVTCPVCGYTRLFNLITLGVLDEQRPAETNT